MHGIDIHMTPYEPNEIFWMKSKLMETVFDPGSWLSWKAAIRRVKRFGIMLQRFTVDYQPIHSRTGTEIV
jgi:hypothetical protein